MTILRHINSSFNVMNQECVTFYKNGGLPQSWLVFSLFKIMLMVLNDFELSSRIVTTECRHSSV